MGKGEAGLTWSHSVVRPVLNQYVHTAAEFKQYAAELFGLVKDGSLKLALHKEYPFSTEGIKQTQIDISEPRPLPRSSERSAVFGTSAHCWFRACRLRSEPQDERQADHQGPVNRTKGERSNNWRITRTGRMEQELQTVYKSSSK